MNQPTEKTTWRRRLAAFWRRCLAALRGPDPVPQPAPAPPLPPGHLVERRSITPIDVAARGFAFQFQVHGVFVWSSDGLERQHLRSLVDRFAPYAHRYLKGIAAGLARGVEPHRGEEFEGRLRRRLRDLGDWSYTRDGMKVTCRPQVHIQLDERVQQHIRPFWEELISLDYERDVAARRARHTARTSTQWAAVLDELLTGPVPGAAASMTNERLADVVREVLKERLAEQQTLADAMTALGPQNEYAREGFFDLLEEHRGPA
ncbi:hypothetical protein AB0M02_22830 [Actinoplanes sp. NPDC051861]|uniref:hypothetical protein n=1 Tax=Actinoplanes sp. NPDC051861 TaxID=3155170 RepID=UPI00344730F2